MWASGKKAAGGGSAGFDSFFKARRITTPQTLTTATWTKILFNTTDYDNLTEFDTGANSRFTAQNTGYYHFDASVYCESPGTAQPIECMCQLDGGGVWYPSMSDMGVATISHNRCNFGWDFYLTAGQTVDVWCHHYKGSNADVEIESVFTGHRFH
ncbi:MAG: hypothetical protein GY782_01175 [Gammaproteobacteria bacterium]|nr:hypothetical protein [Gammaproteobacteria bacterium]